MKAPGLSNITVSSGDKPISTNSPNVIGLLVNSKRGIPNKKKFLSTFEQAQTYLGDFSVNSYTMYVLKSLMDFHGANKVWVNRVVGSTAVKATGTLGTDPSDIEFTLESPGADGNNFKVIITKHTLLDEYTVSLYAPVNSVDTLIWTASGLSSDPADVKYLVSYINNNCDWLTLTDSMNSKTTFDALFASGSVTVTFTGGVDSAPIVTDYAGNSANKTGVYAFDSEKSITTLMVPDSTIVVDGASALAQDALVASMVAWCEGKEKVNYVDVVPKDVTADNVKALVIDDWNLDSINAVIYWNWVKILDPLTGVAKLIPPHGTAVGVWNEVDGREGVHKAPANEICKGVIGLQYEDVTEGERGLLNEIGVNPIIALDGFRVYGARMRTTDAEWKYIHVRRTYQMHLSSIIDSSNWIVFTIKDNKTMGTVRRNIENYFRKHDRRLNPSGSLYNKKNPTEAPYYVIVDERNNTGNDGELVIDWGICIVDTNEFVKYRTSQWDGGQETVRVQ